MKKQMTDLVVGRTRLPALSYSCAYLSDVACLSLVNPRQQMKMNFLANSGPFKVISLSNTVMYSKECRIATSANK